MKPANLYMTDFSGARLPLHRMTSSEAERTLGVRLAADGNMLAEFEHHKSQAYTWATQVATYKTDPHTQWINFHATLIPKLTYPLMATTLMQEQCEQILRPALYQLLPAIGIN